MAFVDPPMARATTDALWTASAEMIVDGVRSFHTASTASRPLAAARRDWSAITAGIDEAPGSENPSTSAMAVMVEAVPIVMQWPGVRAMPLSIPFHSHSEMLPARSSSQYFHTSDPLPSVWPFQQPLIIGPEGK